MSWPEAQTTNRPAKDTSLRLDVVSVFPSDLVIGRETPLQQVSVCWFQGSFCRWTPRHRILPAKRRELPGRRPTDSSLQAYRGRRTARVASLGPICGLAGGGAFRFVGSSGGRGRLIRVAADQKQAEEEQRAAEDDRVIGLSHRRCMKNSATSEALMDAIIMAMITFVIPPPQSISRGEHRDHGKDKQRGQHRAIDLGPP